MNAIVFYCGTGQGFKSPADAIVRELQARGVGAEAVDFYAALGMDGVDSFIKESWKFCLRHPWFFNIVYATTDSPLIDLCFFWQLGDFRRRMARFMEGRRADFVVSTHFASTWLLARWAPVVDGTLPFFGYNSDVLLSHYAYIQKDVAAYFVSTELGRDRMIAQGMEEEKVRISGFPIDPKYRKAFRSRAEERAALGLEDMFTVLLTFGGEGIGDLSFVRRIAASGLPVQVAAVCGRNEAVRAKLEALRGEFPGFRIATTGFVSNLQDYLYACDVSAGKAGLNTVFESIYMKRPFLVLMAMTNEKHCARFAVERGYAVHPRDADGALDFLKDAVAGGPAYSAALAALENPPCEFAIDSMVDEMVAVAGRRRG